MTATSIHVYRLEINFVLLDFQGEWHQYDDVIYLELKKDFWLWGSAQGVVIKGRDLAGKVMLNIIFELLTTWDEPNVDNFFFLLRQFCCTYSRPVLDDGMVKPWGLPYGSEQVNLKGFILGQHKQTNLIDKNSFQQELPPEC